MRSSREAAPGSGALQIWWPTAATVVDVASVLIIIAANLANLARLPCAFELKLAGGAGLLLMLACAIVNEILERLKITPKTKSSNGLLAEIGAPPPRREPIPITDAAALDAFARPTWAPEAPEKPEPDPLTPLNGGALPDGFSRAGAKAVWSLAPLKREAERRAS